jgi:hypothetical protein
MLAKERLLLEAGPLEDGFFILSKIQLVIEGENVPRAGRCDNLSISAKSLSADTEYEKHSIRIGTTSDYSKYTIKPSDIKDFDYSFCYYPHFLFLYMDCTHSIGDDKFFFDLQKSTTPASMWGARSIYQLFKNMREWSFMAEEPFNLNHPMAEYSKIVFQSLEVPQSIIDEIDTMPEMHLAKFLKGQNDYRKIPDHPVISDTFKNWVWETANKYPYKQFEEQI